MHWTDVPGFQLPIFGNTGDFGNLLDGPDDPKHSEFSPVADCSVNLDSLAIPAILAILAVFPGLTDGSIFR
jgi:hypothetical protein